MFVVMFVLRKKKRKKKEGKKSFIEGRIVHVQSECHVRLKPKDYLLGLFGGGRPAFLEFDDGLMAFCCC